MQHPEFPLLRAQTAGFRRGIPRNVSISRDGSSVLFLRSDGTNPAHSLWQLTDGSGEREVLAPDSASDGDIPAAERAQRERLRESASGITTFTTDTDHRLVFTAVSGQLVQIEVASGAVTPLAAGGVTNPVANPQGSRVAFGRDGGVFVADVATGTESTVGLPEDEDSFWGLAEFIAAEEMGRYRGMWWSPSGDELVLTKVDNSPLEQWWIGNPALPEVAPQPHRYPQAGTANSSVELHIWRAGHAEVHQINWKTVDHEYLARVSWNRYGHPIVLTQNREQTEVAITEIDPISLETTVVETRQQLPWVDLIPGAPCQGPAGIVDVRADPATDTYRIAIVADQEMRWLTPAEQQVRSIQQIDADGVWYQATTDRITGQFWFCPWHDEPPQLVSGNGYATGNHRGGTTVISESGETGLPRFSVTGHVTGNLSVTAVSPPFLPKPLYLAVGTEKVNTAVLLPAAGGDNLPIIMSPYGGPHGQRVVSAMGAYVTEQWLADQGYCVIVSDGPGSPGAPSWEFQMKDNLAEAALSGQIRALEAVADRLGDQVDVSRVGIRGWSFGGYLAALAVLEQPDVFHGAVAGAPVTEWRLYDTHYTERYLGTPQENQVGYDRDSLLTKADQLNRPLLIVHGLADDNVVAAHTLRFSSELLGYGRPHQVLPLSGVTHMTPQEEVAANLLKLELDFLSSALSGEQRR